MKKKVFAMLLLCSVQSVSGQDADSSSWEIAGELNYFVIPDDYFFMPVGFADYKKLHLEARYNYEDRETFSGWIGYNFTGGKKVEYFITPMVGVVRGNTRGVSMGLEVTLNFGKFELYTESELLIDPKATENNYYYQWATLTYAASDWLSVGLVGQRTRLYQTRLEIQRGLLAQAAFGHWTLTGHLLNIGFDDPFGIITVLYEF